MNQVTTPSDPLDHVLPDVVGPKLSVCAGPGLVLYFVLEDKIGRVFDSSTRMLRDVVAGEREPATRLVETSPGHYVVDLTSVVAALPPNEYLLRVTRDDVTIRVFANLGGQVSSRDDWALIG